MRRDERGGAGGAGGAGGRVRRVDGRRGDDADGAADAGGRVRAQGVVVRRMVKSDLGAVMAIEKAAFGSPWSLSTFAGLLRRENTRLWVAERSGEVAGYAAVWMVAGQAELGDLAVAAGWRRRGVGRMLLETVLEEMVEAGIRELFLEVRVSNEGARRLYGEYGFEEVGRRPGYYTKPTEDALVLRRRMERAERAR